MKKLLLTASLAVATLFATAASAQVIYTASFVSNPDQWANPNYGWQSANGTVNFTNGYLSYSSAGTEPYIGSYGPSGVPDWDGNFVPLNITSMFAPGNMPSITFDARASAPNGTTGLNLELQSGHPQGYIATSAPLTTDWQTFTMNSFSSISGSANPAGINVIAFATGFVNMGTIDIRNLTIAAIPEPSSFAALAGLAALAGVGLRRRRRA